MLALALVAAAVVPGVWTTWGLHWPFDLDHFRDIAIAQTMQDGGWLADPFYAGERAWYNPLIPAIVAVTSTVTQMPVPDTLTRIGAWINAIPPLLFFLCARRLSEPLAALPALCAYLFLPHSPPVWGAATYTPWLFPSVAAHALFYGGLLVWLRALEPGPRVSQVVVAGVILGLTILAHMAPALVLAGIIVVTALLTPARLSSLPSSHVGKRLLGLATVAIPAACVAAVFLLPIAWHYGFVVRNRAPGSWIDERFSFGTLSQFLKPTDLPTIVLVSLGTASLIQRMRARGLAPADAILIAWATVALACFVISSASQSSASSLLPTLVPAYHFYFLLRALACVLFGVGFIAIARALARWWSRRTPHRAVTGEAIGVAVSLLLAAALYPDYLKREAFRTARTRAIEIEADGDHRAAYDWIRTRTPPDAVILAMDEDALRIAGAAGRKVVCVHAFFSNPYVDRGPRAAARDRLFAAIAADDRDTFREVAQPFGVTHVIVPHDRLPHFATQAPAWLRTDLVLARRSIAYVVPSPVK